MWQFIPRKKSKKDESIDFLGWRKVKVTIDRPFLNPSENVFFIIK